MATVLGRRTRALPLLALTALALALGGCAPDPNGPAVSGPALDDRQPSADDPGAGSGSEGTPLSEACEAAFPDTPFGRDLSEAPTVPADWTAPDGVELCTAFQSSDTTAVLQYATSLEPDAVLDAWEPLLGGYATERSDGIAGWPILNAYAGDLEFAIQTDGESNTIVVAFQEGDA